VDGIFVVVYALPFFSLEVASVHLLLVTAYLKWGCSVG